MGGSQNFITGVLIILTNRFDPTVQQMFDTEVTSMTDQSDQLARFMINLDPQGVQFFLVIKAETWGTRCVSFDGLNSLSSSMIHHGTTPLQTPLVFGHYQMFNRNRYTLKYQRTKIAFVFFPSVGPAHCPEVDLDYPQDLQTKGIRPDRLQDMFFYMVNRTFPWKGYNPRFDSSQQCSELSNIFLVNFNQDKSTVNTPSHVQIDMYSLHCPDHSVEYCIQTILITDLATPLDYSALLQLAESYRDLHQSLVVVWGIQREGPVAGEDEGFLDSSIAKILRGREALRASQGTDGFAMDKLLVDLSDKANFTVYIPQRESTILSCSRLGYIKRDIIERVLAQGVIYRSFQRQCVIYLISN